MLRALKLLPLHASLLQTTGAQQQTASCPSQDHTEMLQATVNIHHSEAKPVNDQLNQETETLAEAEDFFRSISKIRNASWSPDRYWVFAQHKTGTMMGMQAVELIKQAIPNIPIEVHSGFGAATNKKAMGNQDANACVLHIARNPFEMLVSGYLYHRSEAEAWVQTQFGKAVEADKKHGECGMDWFCEANRGIAQLWQKSLSGPVADWLPDAGLNETFTQYLQRVSVDEGLIAESIWARPFSLGSMNFTSPHFDAHPCAINVCLSEFYEDCWNTWERVFSAWKIQKPLSDQMLHAAEDSCPKVSKIAVEHSSSAAASRMKHSPEHPPEHEMVTRLKELDRQLLNGQIAELEAQVPHCQVSGKYKGWAWM
mmetsp:Transcript_44645/g.74264  ORF Transcript_44645/g.74264 Transcript_44645/m.74264 type:complete len:369 (-) Transcript_44645:73-1179(-)